MWRSDVECAELIRAALFAQTCSSLYGAAATMHEAQTRRDEGRRAFTTAAGILLLLRCVQPSSLLCRNRAELCQVWDPLDAALIVSFELWDFCTLNASSALNSCTSQRSTLASSQFSSARLVQARDITHIHCDRSLRVTSHTSTVIEACA